MMQLPYRIFLVLAFSFHQNFVACRSGYISKLVMGSKFHCDRSKMMVYSTRSELQCVQKCAGSDSCRLLNYQLNGSGKDNCEIFRLPDNHKSCKMSRGEKSWKALVYKVNDGRLNF